jgi:adenosylhomocysteinase
MENTVYELPREQDQELARLKLETMGLEIDALTQEQVEYFSDYSSGT